MNREKCCALCQSITCKTFKKIKKKQISKKKKKNIPVTLHHAAHRRLFVGPWRFGTGTRLRPSAWWVIYSSSKVNEVTTLRVQTFRFEWHHNRFSLHTVQCWHDPDAFVIFLFFYFFAGNFTNTVKVATGPPLSLRWPPLFLGFFF